MDSDEAALSTSGATTKYQTNNVFALSNLMTTPHTPSEAAESGGGGKRANIAYTGATCCPLYPHTNADEIRISLLALESSARDTAPQAVSGALRAFWLVLAQLVGQTLLAIGILIFIMFFVDQRAFNVAERRPHYELANGTIVQVPSREWYPLQSDITTIISVAFNLLGKSYAAWLAIMTWNYAFLLLERNGMRLKTLNSMISIPPLPGLFPPPGFETDPSNSNRNAKRILSAEVAFIMFSVVPASFSSPLLTGSISWRASIRNITDADVVGNIGLGINVETSDPWPPWVNYGEHFRMRYVDRGAALATHAWNRVTGATEDPPTFKRVIPSLQNLPVSSSLNNVTVPWFKIESFNWITNATEVSADQIAFSRPNNTPGVLHLAPGCESVSPLSNTLHTTAILPDIAYNSLNLSTTWITPEPVKLEDKAGIVILNTGFRETCSSGNSLFGEIPSNIFVFGNTSGGLCFVFAHITYSAGVTTCYGCTVVFPMVVQSLPATELTLEADIMTQHALYLMVDVIGEIVNANVTLPSAWNNMENYTKELLMRGYSSAWTAMSELVAVYTPYPTTRVTIPITMSQAFVDYRRVWGWFALQGMAFAGGIVFLIHICTDDKYPIADPLLRGLMIDVNMTHDERKEANDDAHTWPEDFGDTLIVWKRNGDTPGFTIKGGLQLVRFIGSFSSW